MYIKRFFSCSLTKKKPFSHFAFLVSIYKGLFAPLRAGLPAHRLAAPTFPTPAHRLAARLRQPPDSPPDFAPQPCRPTSPADRLAARLRPTAHSLAARLRPTALPPDFASRPTRRPTSHSLTASYSAISAVCAHISTHSSPSRLRAAVRAFPASSPPTSCAA